MAQLKSNLYGLKADGKVTVLGTTDPDNPSDMRSLLSIGDWPEGALIGGKGGITKPKAPKAAVAPANDDVPPMAEPPDGIDFQITARCGLTIMLAGRDTQLDPIAFDALRAFIDASYMVWARRAPAL